MAVYSGPVGNVRRDPAAAWRHLDFVLVGAVLALALLGVLMVYSSTRGPTPPYYAGDGVRQMAYVGLGVVLMAAVSLVDYRVVHDLALPLYLGSCALLVLVVSPLGSARKGAQAWFALGPVTLQPSEFAKLGLIAALAAIGSHFRHELDVGRVAALLGLVGLPLALIMLQPDLGTALVFVALAAGILVVAGAPGRVLAALALAAIVASVVVLQAGVLQQYQVDRLTSFLKQDSVAAVDANQEAMYNVNQSKVAIGNGGLTGQGLFAGAQTRLNQVPEQRTDFIFTAVGEQWGFLGGATMIGLFAVVVWRVWRTAQLSRDGFGTLLCVGVACMFLFQIFENMGMAMGIMPVTGIPLPFVSYGGSSIVAYFMAVGLVLSVHARRFS